MAASPVGHAADGTVCCRAGGHLPPLLLVLVLVTALVGFICRDQYLRAQKRPATSHGSAHWAQGAELRPYRPAKHDQAPLVLGKAGRTRLALSEHQQQEHVLVVGPTGKGKGVYIVVPALLREPGTRSVFAIDPKSELVRLTAGALAERHRVWVFAPETPEQSLGYNPLCHLRTFADAQDFAKCWVQNTGTSSEPYYTATAEMLIAGVAWHLHLAEPDAPFARLAEVLITHSFDDLVNTLEQSPAEAVKNICVPFLQNVKKDGRAQGNVMSGLATRFMVTQNEAIQRVTRTNALDFAEMVAHPTALFLAIPSSASERLRPISACLLMQMFAEWVRLAETSGGRLSRQVMCYLDEFGNAGVIPHFAERIATLRSLNVGLLIVIQAFAQLYKLYGREIAEIILSNASTHVVLQGIGAEEARYYSQRLGMTTAQSKGQTATGHSEHAISRPLLTPDEIRTMPEGQLLVVIDTAHPVLAHAKPYYREKALAQRANRPVVLRNRRLVLPDDGFPLPEEPTAEEAPPDVPPAAAGPAPVTPPETRITSPKVGG